LGFILFIKSFLGLVKEALAEVAVLVVIAVAVIVEVVAEAVEINPNKKIQLTV